MSIDDVRKRGRGRPKVGAEPITVRMPPEQLAALDKWIEGQEEPRPSRPEAIRQLLDKALA
jgi:Arc/MetJ-type ribon-helix-helix transcriptional regulator